MFSPTSNQNVFYCLRHGRSKANEAGLIVSTMENGTKPDWGLHDIGVQQAQDAGRTLRNLLDASSPGPVLFVTSPFSRTRQTAENAILGLGLPVPLEVLVPIPSIFAPPRIVPPSLDPLSLFISAGTGLGCTTGAQFRVPRDVPSQWIYLGVGPGRGG